MKNILKMLLLASLCLFMVVSCGSEPETKTEEPVVVDEPATVEPEKDSPLVSFKEYTVVKGDTLSQIAEKFYGNKDKAYFFPIIMVYNVDNIPSFLNPDVIEPGWVVRVPDFDEFMSSPEHVQLARLAFEKEALRYSNKGLSGVAKLLRERAQRMVDGI